MPRFAANLSFLFTELPFLDRFEAAAEAGFKAVESTNRLRGLGRRTSAARLEGQWADAGAVQHACGRCRQAVSAGSRRCRAARRTSQAAFETALQLCAGDRRTPHAHAWRGLVHHGARRDTYVANLRQGGDGRRQTVGVEAVDRAHQPPRHSGLLPQQDRTRRASSIHEVGEPNLGLQLDLYHRQVEEGDVADGDQRVRAPSRATTRSPARPTAASPTRAS